MKKHTDALRTLLPGGKSGALLTGAQIDAILYAMDLIGKVERFKQDFRLFISVFVAAMAVFALIWQVFVNAPASNRRKKNC